MAVSLANIFMAAVETEIINRCHFKPLTWKTQIDDIFSLWNVNKEEINSFIELANSYHPTIKFTAEISDKEITFLDTFVYKGEKFKNESILDMRTHFKPTETFQYTHFTSCHPPGVRKGFIKGEALRLLRTNSSKATFEENIIQFKRRLRDRGYPDNLIENTLSEIIFSERMSALQNKQKTRKRILPFVTEYRPSVPCLKNILMSECHDATYASNHKVSGILVSSKWRSPVQSGNRQFKVTNRQYKVAIASSKWRLPVQSSDRQFKVANRQFK